jgi:tetratricopeptide (TPR) repeat protein/O-antigen ligase
VFRRAVVYACALLYLTLGAAPNGIVQPQLRLMGLIGVILVGAAWLIGRRLARWTWQQTSMDAAILVWIAAFCISLIANIDQGRRIAAGLWYAGAYLLLWLLLHDLIANRAITRRVLMNALLLSGLLILLFGFVQTRTWLTSSLPLILNGALEFTLPRPVSTLGNANTLGAFLAVLIPFALEAARANKGVGRVIMALYALLAFVLLALTYSRGAWIGAAAGVAVYALLLARRADLLSPPRLRAVWHAQTPLRRGLIGAAALVVIAAGVGALALVSLSTFAPGGRAADTRTWIYNTAIHLFTAQPLSGSGLFTFGAGIARYYGNPPLEIHAHAHNLILHVAAELGIPGVIALALSVWAVGRAIWRGSRGDPLVIAGAGAVTAFAIHHLFDVPSMNPAVALISLFALVIAAAPLTPIPLIGFQRRIRQIVVPTGAAALALSGLWNAAIYQQYAAIITGALSGAIPADAAAERLNAVIAADPAQSVYVYEQGLLYGLAGDRVNAAAAFERFTDLDPDFALGWMNLAALAGDHERALSAAQRAVETGGGEAITWYHLGEAQGRAGDLEGAQASYRAALVRLPDLRLLSTWDDDPIRASVTASDPPPLYEPAQTLLLLRSGDTERARATWAAGNYHAITPSPTSAAVVDALLALHAGDLPAAQTALDAGRAWILTAGDSAWAHYGAACAARYSGDETSVLAEIEAARAASAPDLYAADWQFGANFGYTLNMSLMIPRVFVPEVEYPAASPTLVALLEAFVTPPETRYSSCP